jgi:RNA polymerase sigma-70 factor, ECF subfamily
MLWRLPALAVSLPVGCLTILVADQSGHYTYVVVCPLLSAFRSKIRAPVLSVSQSQPMRYELHDPDVRLMLQVRDGNAAAFEELVLRYQGRLLTVLSHLVGSREQAEDLAQEVFLRVFRARERYEPGAKFSTWLFTIANHVASNALRSRSRRKESTVGSAVGGDSTPLNLDQIAKAASGMMPARQIDKAETAEMVRLAIESLGERQRMALLLSKFEGMGYQDIAEAMDLSIPAVKSLLSRARVSLKEILVPYMETGARPPDAIPATNGE